MQNSMMDVDGPSYSFILYWPEQIPSKGGDNSWQMGMCGPNSCPVMANYRKRLTNRIQVRQHLFTRVIHLSSELLGAFQYF